MAERTDIDESLRDTASWASEREDVKDAFAAEMLGRRYGHEALLDAWLWFAAGWRRARRCDSCDWTFGCFNGIAPCIKRPIP